MAEEEKKNDKQSLLDTARERYKRGVEWDDDNRKNALDALKFRNGEQWDPEIKRLRETDPEGARPCPVVDKTNQYLRQVVNDEKQNRPSIKIRPVDDKGDPEVAKVLQGLVRNIEDQSGADLAYDTAYEQAADGGFGYFRILTEYTDPMSFDQDIRIKRIRNRFQVVLDDARQEPDGSDAQWGFIAERVKREEFKAQYPNADPCDFADAGDAFKDWIGEKDIIVAEYFHFETRKAKICLYTNGQTYENGKAPPDAGTKVIGKNGRPVERETTLKQLKWKKITAKEVLEERDLPGEYIPIVEVIGEELDIEGRSHKHGLLDRAKTPQVIHNYGAANFIETVGLAPRAQWVAEERQIQGYENLYKTANRRNIAVLPYKAVVEDGVIVPPPQRAQPAGIAAGWLQVLQLSEHDISASMGMYAETVLGTGDAQSGKQEALQQKRGDTATFHFMDNLARSVRHAGKIILSWIPTYYDTARVARIIGEDGQEKMVRLDPNQETAVAEQAVGGKMEPVYNLKVGKYDVSVQTGPGFMTKRQEAVEFLSTIAQAAKDPATSQIVTYLAVKNNDWAGAEEATKMLKKTLPPGVAEPDEGEEEAVVQTPQGPLPASQASQLIGQLMGQVEQAGAAMQEAGDLEQVRKEVQGEAAKVDAAKKDIEKGMERIKAAEREFELRRQLAEANERAVRAEQQCQAVTEQAQAVEKQNEEVTQQAEAKGAELQGVGEAVMALVEELRGMRQEIAAGQEQVIRVVMSERESTLEFDPEGNPIKSRSRPILETVQ